MKLRCAARCEASRTQQLFSVNVTVDGDGRLAENAQKIPAQYFECVFCQSPAEWQTEGGTPPRDE